MKKTQLLALVNIFFSAAIATSSAYAESYPELKQLITAKDYQAAYKLAASMSDKESGDADFDLQYGIAAREAGHPEIAIFAFERALMKNPKDAHAQYEKGKTLLKVKDYRGAKVALSTVLKLKSSKELKKSANKVLEVVKKALEAKAKAAPKLHASFGVGYNTNVNAPVIELDDDENEVTGPPTGDGYATLAVSGSIKKALSKRDNLFFSIGSNNRKYFTSPENKDHYAANAKFGVELGVGPLQLKIPFETDLAISNSTISRLSGSLGAELGKTFADVHWVSLSADFVARQVRNPKNSQRNIKLEGSYKGKFLKSALQAEARLSYSPTVSSGDGTTIGNGVKDDFGALARVKYTFLKAHLIQPEFKFSYSNFLATPPADTDPRRDFNIQAKISYDWMFAKGWSVGPTYFLVYKNSNRPTNTVLRHQVQLGLTVDI